MPKPTYSYWADIYQKLDAKHRLWLDHELTLPEFIERPGHCQHWITMYFSNAALLINRPHGGAVKLSFFLEDPEQILLAVLRAETLRTRYQPESFELLTEQKAVVTMLWWGEAVPRQVIPFLPEHDELECAPLEWHGWGFIQPFHHYRPSHKYKTRGGHRKRAA